MLIPVFGAAVEVSFIPWFVIFLAGWPIFLARRPILWQGPLKLWEGGKDPSCSSHIYIVGPAEKVASEIVHTHKGKIIDNSTWWSSIWALSCHVTNLSTGVASAATTTTPTCIKFIKQKWILKIIDTCWHACDGSHTIMQSGSKPTQLVNALP